MCLAVDWELTLNFRKYPPKVKVPLEKKVLIHEGDYYSINGFGKQKVGCDGDGRYIERKENCAEFVINNRNLKDLAEGCPSSNIQAFVDGGAIHANRRYFADTCALEDHGNVILLRGFGFIRDLIAMGMNGDAAFTRFYLEP